ncbi:S53 family peptidase [Scleromatobacter humisilvae]|uniref:S53 family peptidase n=1 Tax=Scleromatobacter humisilvae TaxID=2897159 RepID=A0A9X1YN05_9BURK|nr:S53 family peptidase [Scleromatobacter humisilvae]MCK9684516.1 S53 family peptidase [Scleromatobacter humisilvae]
MSKLGNIGTHIGARRKVSLALMAALGTLSLGAQAEGAHTKHVHAEIPGGQAQMVGTPAATQVMNLDIVLPVRDREGLQALARAITDPDSPMFRHYITPAQFTERFGPTQADYEAVRSYMEERGLKVTGGTRDGMDLQVQGSIDKVEKAFHVTMRNYKHPTENRTFFSPDREPTTDLAVKLWHVSGMDNFSIPKPKYVKRTDYAAARGISEDAVVSHATTGSGPSASFLGSDMRAAYYGSGSLTGAGQHVALFEYYGTDLADLTTYYKNIGQTNKVPVTLISTDGTSTSCTAKNKCDDGEQELDITQALGMAPGLAGLEMYVGSTDTAIISAMTTHSPLAGAIGCSWGWTPADASTLDPYFEKMAVQGQSFFVASGDNSTWTKSGNAESWPADDANIIAVGGTDLVTASAGGAWKSETAWVDSGGGISPNKIKIPTWQQTAGVITSTNKGSTSYRNGPDVAANANFTFYTCDNQTTCQANAYGGTSFAAPMWAGLVALANQQAASQGKGNVGFFNPKIYSQNVTSSYSTGFHDVTSGKSGSYSAGTNFDLVTGWGSPKPAIITQLLK